MRSTDPGLYVTLRFGTGWRWFRGPPRPLRPPGSPARQPRPRAPQPNDRGTASPRRRPAPPRPPPPQHPASSLHYKERFARAAWHRDLSRSSFLPCPGFAHKDLGKSKTPQTFCFCPARAPPRALRLSKRGSTTARRPAARRCHQRGWSSRPRPSIPPYLYFASISRIRETFLCRSKGRDSMESRQSST